MNHEFKPRRNAKTDSRPLRVGLIGAGYVSQFHIAALQRLRDTRIVGVCDLDAELAARVAHHAKAAAFTSIDQLLNADIDVVHVLTPPHTHAALALKALERGCHVLVEKPLATNAEDCDRIAEAARRADRSVCVNHSLLRDPFVAQALSIVKSGALGEIVAVDYLRSSDYPPYRGGPLPPQYRDGGYPFRDLGVHALYLIEAFLGEILDATAQFESKAGDVNLLYDEWRVLVKCARGSGQVQLSWNVRPIQNILIVQGTRGVLRANLFSLNVTTQKSTSLPKPIERTLNAWNEGLQTLWQVSINALGFLRGKMLPYHGLQVLVAEFYSSLNGATLIPVTPAQARPIVAWTEHIARPADEAKTRYLDQFIREPAAKVLLTGANGFIGRHLLPRLLARYHRVRILVRREPPPAVMHDPRIEVVLGDLGDPAAVDRALANIEIVYHLGAATKGNATDFERGTVVGTKNVVDSMIKHRVPKLVYLSSLSVLHAAAASKDTIITESWPLEPHAELRGAYTQTKLEAERLVLSAAKNHSLSVIVLRPGQVCGPGAPVLTPAVARRVKNRLIVLGDGKARLPLIYVDDLIDAIELAAQSDRFDGSVFHVVDPTKITQNQLLAQWLDATHESLTAVRVPLPIVDLVAYCVELLAKLMGRPAPLSRYRIRSALAPISFDCSAAEVALNWRPRVGVRAGLEQTLLTLNPTHHA